MGWTEIYFEGYLGSKRKQQYKKAYIDKLFTWESETRKISVVKSSFVGSVYYAAIRVVEKDAGKEYVTAEVVQTCTRDGKWFGYKEAGENCGPREDKCPLSILKLLDPTDSERANEWRRKCYENAEKAKAIRKAGSALGKLPTGAKITFPLPSNLNIKGVEKGAAVTLEKAMRRGIIAWFGCGYRWPVKYIPQEYTVLGA